jgi:hypothetical protein
MSRWLLDHSSVAHAEQQTVIRTRLRLYEEVHGSRGLFGRVEADGMFQDIHTRPCVAVLCLRSGMEHPILVEV